MTDYVLLVDENDNPLRSEEKLKAHQEGSLHRAFSILLFNSKNEYLLQKRALSKYHCGGLWSNTCCSHPRPGEETLLAAHRRLKEELGIVCGKLEKKFDFIYKAAVNSSLTEHEFDHVFFGTFEGAIKPNPEEVCAYAWVAPEILKKDVENHPEKYTIWFRILLDKVKL